MSRRINFKKKKVILGENIRHFWIDSNIEINVIQNEQRKWVQFAQGSNLTITSLFSSIRLKFRN